MPDVAHSSLTGSDLHEPKGVASANANEVYVADGSTSGSWGRVPGTVVQRAYAEYTTYSSHTSQIPYDDTTPLSSEGFEVLSVSFTPKASDNKILVLARIEARSTASSYLIGTVFDGTTCKGVATNRAGVSTPIFLLEEYTTGSTSARDISVRVGTDDGSTFFLNGDASSRKFNGVSKAVLEVLEIEV